MAVRLNTKFIAILLMATVAAVGVVFVLWKLQERGDVGRHIRAGDEYMERGEPELAVQYYGRAVYKQPTNLVYMEKMRDALRAMRPQTADAAGEAYRLWLGSFSQEAHYHAQDPEAHLRYINEVFSGARLRSLVMAGGAPRGTWEEVAVAAQNMLDRLPETEPKRIYGKLYRGLARIRQVAFLPADEIERAERDLHEFVEAMPEDDFGWATLLRSKSILVDHLRISAQPRRAQEKERELLELLERAAEQVPDGVETLSVRLLHMAYRRSTGENIPVETIQQLMSRLVEFARQVDDPWLMGELGEVVQVVDVGDGEGRARAVDLYRSYLDRFPEAVAHRYFLARIQHLNNDLDSARRTAEQVIESPPAPVGLVSLMQLELQRLAAALVVDLEYQRWSQADETDRPAIRTALIEARDRLRGFGTIAGTNPGLVRADGKIALVNEDYQTAAAKFEQLVRDGATDLETLVNASIALERIGQIGLAHERVATALENPRAAVWLLSRRGMLEYRMGRFNEAAVTISDYLARVPDDTGARELHQVIQSRRSAGGGVGEAETAGDPTLIALEETNRAFVAGDIDTARATVRAAIDARQAAGDEDDVRLLGVAARIELFAGQTEEARPFVDRALALRPDDPGLRQLQAVVETGDVIAAAKQVIEASHTDPAERAVQLVVSYDAIASEERQRAEEMKRRADAAGAARSLETAERAAAARDAEVARIRAASETSELAQARKRPQFIGFEFTQALEARDWPRAEQLAERARELDSDQMRGLQYRGRYEHARGRYEQAVRAFQQAAELMPFNSAPWRGLALSYMRLGNFREAQRAFEQAYRANPNDITTVRQFLAMLVQMREHARAAQIARNAHQLVPQDVQLREMWLDLEYEQGNVVTAFTERRRIRERHPRDRRNLLRFAMLLASADPTYELILDSRGAPAYTDRTWRQLGTTEQRRQLQQLRERWRAEAEAIVDEVEGREGSDIEIAALRATLFRLRGEALAGERVLKDYIASHDPSDQTPEMHIVLSQHYAETGNVTAALDSLREAVTRQGDTVTGDLAMGSFLFSRGHFAPAAQHLERAVAVQPNRDVSVRLAECHVHLQQFERAEQVVAKILAEGEMDYVVAMVQAMIAFGQGEELVAAGRTAEADRKFEAHRDALETAERLMPTDPSPHLLRAQSLVRQFRHTQRRSLLDDAMRVLDRAELVRPGDARITMARVEVQRAMGNDRTAAAELMRALDRTPSNVELRRRLVQLQLEMDDRNAAMATVSKAIELYPNLAVWHEMQGNLNAMNSVNMVAAAASFRRAYEIGRSPAVLGKYVAVLLAGDSPDYSTAASVLSREPELVNSEPELGALYAMTLLKGGRTELGLREMRRSYEQLRDLIAAGVRTSNHVNSWFSTLNPFFSEQPPALVEQVVRDLTDQPQAVELSWLARYWSSRGANGLDRAADLMREAIGSIQPGNREAFIGLHLELGRYLLMAERYEPSLDAFTKVLEVDPDQVIALNNAAFVMSENLDRAREALPHARRAADLAPQSANVLDTLGTVHYRLGEHGKARETLLKSLELEETGPTLLHLARVLVAEGDAAAARQRLERALEMRLEPKTQAEINRLLDDIRTGGGRP